MGSSYVQEYTKDGNKYPTLAKMVTQLQKHLDLETKFEKRIKALRLSIQKLIQRPNITKGQLEDILEIINYFKNLINFDKDNLVFPKIFDDRTNYYR